ncbi:ADP-ribosylglycohydrolase family protein [Bacillus sp. FJAT-27916]|uniref:ADP-ribosylglycohydrolase family protein n=1 Tax=Bacillus sp. FJAT-27916 TaxID=1679169 RepID=UPI000AF20FCC|nr:ADP-ribosylglycohydrolase family protein [Bacillus sp. FJAT-27916]
MIGAIIGDIVGSRFEFNNHKSKEFELFHEDCRVTDDSIMTLAIAKALMETEKVIQSSIAMEDDAEYDSLLNRMSVTCMHRLGRMYPDCGFGGRFSKWIFNNAPEPYNSFGNGAAMRISPVDFFARTEREVSRLSGIITETTHNHDEGMKGAEAAAMAMFMAKQGYTKSEIRYSINRDYYLLDFTMDEIRDTYVFDVTCQGTVPQAIVAFLESTSFEDAIRTAI